MSKLFQPSQSQIKSSNLSAYEKFLNQSYKKQFKNYSQLWNWSVKNPSDFWKSIADFYKVPLYAKKNAKLIQKNSQFWKTNFFFNYQTNYFCLLEKNKSNDLAIHFIGENKYEEKITYQELNQRVNALSSYYRSLKIKAGDVIVGYLPNIADTVIAFLAAAKIGAVWSSCSSDFGSKAVIDRFSQLKPKLMVVADHYFYNGKKFNYSKNLRQIQKKIGNPKILKTNYPCKNNNSELHKIYNNKKFQLSEMTEIVDFNHPLYVLFSSGTTGLPKCITHGHGGSLLQHLKELSLHTNVKPKDKMLFLTTCGWMMWNWTVSNLLLGSCITLYDGSPFYPNKDRVIQLTKKSKSNMLGAGAKIYEAIQNNHRSSKKNLLPDLKCFISTGSPLVNQLFNLSIKL
jgi:acetoacetyl-CoA synthetase